VNLLILVVDDEPHVEQLFRQQFRRDLRSGRFNMEFAQSAQEALGVIGAAQDRSLKIDQLFCQRLDPMTAIATGS
jgi:CheY-like chemotaxis protein